MAKAKMSTKTKEQIRAEEAAAAKRRATATKASAAAQVARAQAWAAAKAVPPEEKVKPRMDPAAKKVLTPFEVGERLGITEKTVVRYVKSGEIPGTRIGRQYFVP